MTLLVCALLSSTRKSSSEILERGDFGEKTCPGGLGLEAQQRYFSYRAILVAIVSQSSFVLVFMGYRTIIARYVAKWGIAQMCLCEAKCQGGVSHHFGGVPTSPKKYRAI